MKAVPLYTVRYFKGETTRLLSKHLHHDSAFKVATRFVNNLKDKHNVDPEAGVLISITQLTGSSGQPTILTLTNRAHGPLGEGVIINLEEQKDPNWDYPQYSPL